MEILHIIICMVIVAVVIAAFVGLIVGAVLGIEKLTAARRRRNYYKPRKEYPKLRKLKKFLNAAGVVIICAFAVIYLFAMWVLLAIEVCGWIGL